MLVEVVFQYRSLIGKCELGVGLDWDEIEQMTAIESAFAPTSDDRRMKTGRKFRREATKLSALMRGDRINDRVEVSEMGPGGLICRSAPFVARGEMVEIVIDDGDHSYRFRAQGVWLKDDGDDYRVGLQLSACRSACIAWRSRSTRRTSSTASRRRPESPGVRQLDPASEVLRSDLISRTRRACGDQARAGR